MGCPPRKTADFTVPRPSRLVHPQLPAPHQRQRPLHRGRRGRGRGVAAQDQWQVAGRGNPLGEDLGDDPRGWGTKMDCWLVVYLSLDCGTPLENMKVSWDDYSKYMENIKTVLYGKKLFQTTNQTDLQGKNP